MEYPPPAAINHNIRPQIPVQSCWLGGILLISFPTNGHGIRSGLSPCVRGLARRGWVCLSCPGVRSICSPFLSPGVCCWTDPAPAFQTAGGASPAFQPTLSLSLQNIPYPARPEERERERDTQTHTETERKENRDPVGGNRGGAEKDVDFCCFSK